MVTERKRVSVPIRGLFNLTRGRKVRISRQTLHVSVPIRGLFNLTRLYLSTVEIEQAKDVSVPIRGLFNLTEKALLRENLDEMKKFPSPSGDYLI